MKKIEVSAAGLRLAATMHGPEHAPALLALHGWLDNAASFHALAGHLPERRVIALDFPGHGRSAHLAAGACVHYAISDYVAVVLAAADALELSQFDLLGHSLGAGVGSLAAAAAPARIRRLGLIEGLGPLADDPESTLDRFRRAVTLVPTRTRTNLRTFADIDIAAAARSKASGLAAELARPIVERGLERTPHGFRWASDPRLTQPTAMRMAEDQIRRLLGGIACPTWLLLARPETPYLPAAQMRERADCVADIRVEHLGGGHHLQLEHPAAVAASLDVFLR